MPDEGNPSAAELVARWRKRRREILEALPRELRAEYRRLGLLIREVRAEMPPTQQPVRVEEGLQPKRVADLLSGTRTPLEVHREKLEQYLVVHGPSHRRDIVADTGIPAGSLSELLRGPEFEQLSHGLWGLKGLGNLPSRWEAVFGKDGDTLYLKAAPDSANPALDTIIILIWGNCKLRCRRDVSASELKKSIKRSGLSVGRIKGVIEPGDLVLMALDKNVIRFWLTHAGQMRAHTLYNDALRRSRAEEKEG